MTPRDGAGDAPPVTWSQVHAFRVARHHLDRPAPRSRVAQAVGDACGVQAQVMAAAQLAMRVRVRGLVLEDVERALWKDRTIARAWCMRGTVHIVPSDAFAVFVRGSSSRQEDRVAAWFRRTGASKEAAYRILDAAAAAMDRPRTREEIAMHVRDALGLPIEKQGSRGWGSPATAAGFRLGHAVVTVADLAFMGSYRGLACFGPDEGQGSTFVRPDAWLHDWRDLSVEDAEDDLLRRYLRSFGPATVSDFAMWSILSVTRAKGVWARAERDLAPLSLEGRTAWALRRDVRALTDAKLDGPTVRLLPYFDSFLMGHKERRHLVKETHHKRIYRPAGWVYPAVLLDGRVAGEWSYERTSKALRVRVQPYEPFDETVKDLVRAEAGDVARFLEAPEARTTFAKPR